MKLYDRTVQVLVVVLTAGGGIVTNGRWRAPKISKSKSALLSLVSIFLSLTIIDTSTTVAAAQIFPFHAVLQSTANPVPTGQCTLSNTETGSGFAPHLGKWTWSDQESVQFVSCPPQGSAIAVTGQFVMTAANGDEIFGTFETTGTLDPVNGVSVQGGYIFVSGTGRFVNVTGSGIITGHGSATSLVGSLDGVISY